VRCWEVKCRESSSAVSPLVNERHLGRTRAREHRIDSPLRGSGSVRRCTLALMLGRRVCRGPWWDEGVTDDFGSPGSLWYSKSTVSMNVGDVEGGMREGCGNTETIDFDGEA
jgi:hypothetical protein